MNDTRSAFVAIMGTDGSGKTTVANLLEHSLEGPFKVKRCHWRPGILPSPRKLVNLQRSAHDVTKPHARASRRQTFSIFWMIYYFLDFWCGHIFQIGPFLRKSWRIVICERYYYDLFIDPKRYRLSQAPTISKLLGHYAPSPDITVVLIGNPKVIYERKKEISLAEIEEQQEKLTEFFGNRPNTYILDVTSEGPESIALKIEGFVFSRTLLK